MLIRPSILKSDAAQRKKNQYTNGIVPGVHRGRVKSGNARKIGFDLAIFGQNLDQKKLCVTLMNT